MRLFTIFACVVLLLTAHPVAAGPPAAPSPGALFRKIYPTPIRNLLFGRYVRLVQAGGT